MEHHLGEPDHAIHALHLARGLVLVRQHLHAPASAERQVAQAMAARQRRHQQILGVMEGRVAAKRRRRGALQGRLALEVDAVFPGVALIGRGGSLRRAGPYQTAVEAVLFVAHRILLSRGAGAASTFTRWRSPPPRLRNSDPSSGPRAASGPRTPPRPESPGPRSDPREASGASRRGRATHRQSEARWTSRTN